MIDVSLDHGDARTRRPHVHVEPVSGLGCRHQVTVVNRAEGAAHDAQPQPPDVGGGDPSGRHIHFPDPGSLRHILRNGSGPG